jgi:D-alanyl-D-alanine-carboxypeptidase/D-alanyl-D-alanine-endopeptidase
MSKKHITLLFIISSLSFKNSNQVEDTVNKNAKEYLNDPKNAGLAIGIISGAEDYIFCYGDACKNEKIQVDTNTIFEIGSITKIFTSLLLANEVENNKMELRDNISKYLPQCDSSKRITLLNLATHSSGLPRLADNFWQTVKYPDNPYVNYYEKDLCRYLSNIKLNSSPGQCYNYSNVGVGILGYILATNNNTSYENLISKVICKPFNMNSTVIQLDEKQKKHLAVGYADSDAVLPWDFNDATAGQGAIRSTITDMIKFLKFNLSYEKLKGPVMMTQELQFTDKEKGIKLGLGWHIGSLREQKYLFHSGGTGGYRSYIGLLPGSKTGIIILSNSTNDVDNIGISILKELLNSKILSPVN